MNIYQVLLVIFITLKVTNYIDWSWWLVFTPIYAAFAIGLLIAFLESQYPERFNLW